MKELVSIQQEINVPKNRRNEFGKFNYRNAEDILKAAKPICAKYGCVLLLSDAVIEVGAAYTYNTKQEDAKKGVNTITQYNGTRFYIEATATLINGDGESICVKGYAREDLLKSGMDVAQITGAASSYARKYALNGLFAIDDGIDADEVNTGQPQQSQQQTQQQTQQGNDLLELYNVYAVPQIQQALTREDLNRIYNDWPQLQDMAAFKTALTTRRKQLGIKNSNEQ